MRQTEREVELTIELRRHVDTKAQRMLAAAALLWVASEVGMALLDRFVPRTVEVTHTQVQESWL